MKKIVRISESDLVSLIKTFLFEQKVDVKTINPNNLKLGYGTKNDPNSLKNIPLVKELQKKLSKYEGCSSILGTIDGKFGKKTQMALNQVLKNGKCISTVTQAVNKNVGIEKDNKNITSIAGLSKQVNKQLDYMITNNILATEKFTILDDKNSKVHAFLPGYELFKTYYVITGKNRGDMLKTQTMGDWVKENWRNVFSKLWTTKSLNQAADYVDNCYFNQEQWELKNTPSGVFKRAGLVENFMGDLLATTFVSEDYGKRFITWQTCEGKTIPFGFHGTENKKRLDVLNQESIENQKSCRRKMSFGCINFKESDVLEIDSFIKSGQLTIWLPDQSDNIVEIPSNCVSSGEYGRDQMRKYQESPRHLEPGKI
jgi:hypothetical protein